MIAPWSLTRAGYGWLKTVLDAVAEGIMIETGERVVYANDRYAALLGYRRGDELIGRQVAELIGAPDVDRLTGFGRSRARGEQAPAVYDFLARRRDGDGVRLRASVSVARLDQGHCITTFVQPFSDRGPADGAVPSDGPHERLSRRERQVLARLLDGTRVKEIALQLGVSEKTIATHRARLLRKLGLAGNRDLFQYAVRYGLIDWS